MLLLQSELRNFTLHAQDGDIGRCRDFLFDDAQWVLRYMEANTGKWLLGRRVLISPISIEEPILESKKIPVKLSKRDIEEAPGADTEAPISERFERAYYGHFGYPYYWVGGDVWGLHGYPGDLLPDAAYHQSTPGPEEAEKIQKSHLRSMREVDGYTIHAVDEEIGHVADFVLDTGNWAVRYLVVDIRRWLPGPRVLLAPQWIERVSWHQKQVYVDVGKQAIAAAPKFEMPITRDDEVAVFTHFARQPYWTSSWSKAAGQPRGTVRFNDNQPQT